MLQTTQLSCGGPGTQRPLLVSLAEGVGAELTERLRVLPADVTVVPGAVPATEGSLGEVEAGQVISFGARLLSTDHQLSSVSAAETVVIRLFLALTFPSLIFPLQSLPFGLGCLAVRVLWPITQKAAAVWSAAATDCLLVPEAVQVVIKGQLCPCWDVTDSEQANSRVTVHRPLLCLTVGLTAVVHEARIVSLRTGVDDPVLVDGEHVEISDVVLLGVLDPRPALLLINQLSDVLVDKLALLDVPQRDQAPALAGRLDDLGLGVETLGEVLVTAALAAGTHLRVALILQHAVQTLGLKATRPLVRQLAVTLGDLRDVCGVHLNFTEGFVDLDEFVRRRLPAVLLCLLGLSFQFYLLESSFSLQQSILEDFSDAGPLVFAPSVTLHVWKHSTLVGPEIILGAKEEDWELSDLMAKVLDVGGDVSGVVDLCRPPSVRSQFDPDDVSVFGFLSGPAVVAEPAPIRHGNVQAVGVKSCRTGLTAEQPPAFGADEAPADVDVTVVAVALLGVEVVGADDGGVGDHLAASSHTRVADVVRHRAAQATHQPAFGRLLLGAAAVVAAQTGVERTAEALVVEHSERVEADARLMVKLAAVLDVAATHRAVRLLTVETRVNS